MTSTAGDWLMALVLGIWVEHSWILPVMGIGLLVVGVTRYAAVP